ncbi:Type 1 glutamine amidotransferase-like domain-containing protein [Acholeplasma hippikon]|nr:Type 1 glutamine amidotransferase-like domain-containing protein [Acholeplasma hippikon]
MINILSSRTIYEKDHVYEKLNKYITKDKKVCVIAFSFFENNFSQATYLKDYEAPLGKWYLHIVEPFRRYGLDESNFEFILYGKDTKEEAKEKVLSSDIIFLPGGAPDLFYERLESYDLVKVLAGLDNKIVMGPSAGTMVQFNWFHISKDRDYKRFILSDGLGFIEDFGVEVHYRRRKQQKKGIRRVSHFNPRPVYVIDDEGFMILENKEIIYSYHVKKYYQDGKKIR